MSEPELWMVGGMTLVTYLCRYPVLAVVSRVTLPPALLRAMGFIPAAVLTAIIAPAVAAPRGELALQLGNPYLGASLVTCLVAWRCPNLLLTIGAGMGTWWVWRWLSG
ncbi:MAG: AzlD domain-containing protein [Caldilineaceae bacterium]|nr:AzlD domain-containing protein [Caldilineaceae bacterium]